MSTYSHIWTRGLANYRDKALTTGCNSFDECSFKTELLNMTTLRLGFKKVIGLKVFERLHMILVEACEDL